MASFEMGSELLFALCLLLLASCIYANGNESYEPSGNKEEEPLPGNEGEGNGGDTDTRTQTEGSRTIQIIKRKVWDADQPDYVAPALYVNPPRFVVIAHTAGPSCSTFVECSEQVRNIQTGHINGDLGDIGYNFLIGGDGKVYEGLGWGKKGSHTLPFNGYSIGIALMGNFVSQLPPEKQLGALRSFIDTAVKLRKLSPDYKILLQNQVISTVSPGAELSKEIKKWKHWRECDDECSEIILKWKMNA